LTIADQAADGHEAGRATCPLTPALIELLQACLDTGTDDTGALAAILCRTSGTVRTDFKRTFVALGVHDRMEAMLKALDAGWIAPRGEALGMPQKGKQ
jgi:DNA-binding NarL/FixJ family response regulator